MNQTRSAGDLSSEDPSRHFVNVLLTKIEALVRNWDEFKPPIRVCELTSIANTAKEIANHQRCNEECDCICPTHCDCESPYSNPALVSNNCPKHNDIPIPCEECIANTHKNGAQW